MHDIHAIDSSHHSEEFSNVEPAKSENALTLFTEPTFSVPTNPVMFTIIGLFSGILSRTPRSIVEKPRAQRTEQEQKIIDEYFDKILNREVQYSPSGKEIVNQQLVVKDTPRIKAQADITHFINEHKFIEFDQAGILIQRTFGPEGYRHFLAMLKELSETGNTNGEFRFNLARHLESMGYKRTPSTGAFKQEYRKSALDILRVLTSVAIVAQRIDGRKEILSIRKLFTVVGFELERSLDSLTTRDEIIIRAEPAWYSLGTDDNTRATQFSKMLTKILHENHREHYLVYSLHHLLTIFWRMQPTRQIRVVNLMTWCNMDVSDTRRKLDLVRELETELEYMTAQGYIGSWTCNGQNGVKPSMQKDPLAAVLEFVPPQWYGEIQKQIERKKQSFIVDSPKQAREEGISREMLSAIIQFSGLKKKDFAEKIGKTAVSLSYFLSGQRNITKDVSERICKLFPEEYKRALGTDESDSY